MRYDNGEGKEYRCSVLAFDEETKKILDGGIAEINIVEKLVNGMPMLVRTPDGVSPVLKFFINPLPKLGQPVGDQAEAQNRLYQTPKNEEEDIPVIEEEDEPDEKLGY